MDSYLQNYSSNRRAGLSDFDSYNTIVQEEVATRAEAALTDFLERNPEIAAKLKAGESLNKEQLLATSRALDEASKKGLFKTGYQFIQGFLVNVTLGKKK